VCPRLKQEIKGKFVAGGRKLKTGKARCRKKNRANGFAVVLDDRAGVKKDNENGERIDLMII